MYSFIGATTGGASIVHAFRTMSPSSPLSYSFTGHFMLVARNALSFASLSPNSSFDGRRDDGLAQGLELRCLLDGLR
jgi:hypothetical protein